MKSGLDTLALFGGSAAFAEPLVVGRPNVGNREVLFSRWSEILDTERLTNDGPFVKAFERRVQDELGVRYCIATSSGTAALELCLRALGRRGEVIVPSFTFEGTAHAVAWSHLTPVFCDSSVSSHTPSAQQVAALITPKTVAIVGVHLWGRPCDIDGLADVASEAGIALFFDAAHAFGTSHRGIMIGNFGRAETFSFHATKVLNTFEGGAVTTNDADVARQIRSLRNFGRDPDRSTIGTNAKMSEVSAAMGLTGLDRLHYFVDANRESYHEYCRGLDGVRGVRLLRWCEKERCNYHYVVLEVDPNASGVTRDHLLTVLTAENVLCKPYFSPGCHRLAPYADVPSPQEAFPQTELLSANVLCLPSGAQMSGGHVETVCEIIRVCIANAAELTCRTRPLFRAC